MKNYTPEIYISYAWENQPDGSNWTMLVKNLYDTLIKHGYNIKIDVSSIQYKDNIKDFMRQLGKGNYIIVVINEKYLKSKNCMFEALEMFRYKDTRDRIFPIVTKDSDIHSSRKIVEYIKFWETQKKELSDEAKSLSTVSYAAPIYEDIKIMEEILRIFADFGNMLTEMNVLSSEEHYNSDFKELIEKINSKQEFDRKNLEITYQNEQLLIRLQELEITMNNLKLESSRLILENEDLKKTILEQKKLLASSNNFEFIKDKLEEYDKRILKFNKFIGFTAESTRQDVIDDLGNPSKEDDKGSNIYKFYSIGYEDFITIYFNDPSDTIMSISVSSSYNINKLNQYLAYKSIYDSNLNLLEQTSDQILNLLGKPADSRNNILTYEAEGLIVEFTCYDFNQNKCSSIEVSYH